MSVVQIAELQIDQLVKDVMRLDKTGGSDVAALLRIRELVRRELLERDSMEITSSALGRLKSNSAAKKLLHILAYCAEHFEVGSKVYSVVAVPVSVRLSGLNQHGTTLRKAERGPLKEMARMIAEAVGANRVALDTRMYQASAMHQLKARDMRSYLMALAAGTLYPKGPDELELKTQSANAWQLVYLLGVEVIDLPKYPSLDDWPIQRQTGRWLDEASAAIECTDEVLFNPDLFAQAHCHGVFYLSQSLIAGARGHRALRIADMLRALGQVGNGVQIYLTGVLLRQQVRTLMVSPLLALEYTWNLMQEETMREFQSELERVAHEVLDEFDLGCIDWLDADEYERQAMKHQVPRFRIVGGPT